MAESISKKAPTINTIAQSNIETDILPFHGAPTSSEAAKLETKESLTIKKAERKKKKKKKKSKRKSRPSSHPNKKRSNKSRDIELEPIETSVQNPQDISKAVEDEDLEFYQRGAVAELIAEHEKSIGITNTGIGSSNSFGESQDCTQGKNSILYDQEQLKHADFDEGDSYYNSEDEEEDEEVALEEGRWEQQSNRVNPCLKTTPIPREDYLSEGDEESEVNDILVPNQISLDAGIEESARTTRTDVITDPDDFIDLLESSQMERTEAYFLNKGMTVALGGLFFAMNIVVAAHAAYQFTEAGGFTTDDDLLRLTLPIARAGGRLVTFNCAWLLLTGCKNFWTLVRTHLVPVVPIGFPIDNIMPKYHRFVALWVIVSGCIIHSLPQIANYATGAIKVDDGSKVWTLGNGFASRQLLITGTILLLIFTMFFLTTLKAFRKTAAGFRWFWIFHMGGIVLAYPLLIIHGTCKGHPIFLYFAFTPLLLYIFDVSIRRSKITSSKILEWKTHSGGGQRITELVLECPPNFVYTPGQYVDLKFGSISSYEWHPFTIASAPGNDVRTYNGKKVKVLIFFIKSTGRWTEALFNYASAFNLSKATKTMEVSIRGPHGAPAMNFFEYKHTIVIGSGVGVTPLLSVWQYMVNRGRTKMLEDRLKGRLSNNGKASKELDISRNTAQTSCSNELDISRNSTHSTMSWRFSGDFFINFKRTHSSKFRLVCSKIENILESLTISMCLFGFFLSGETIMMVMNIFGRLAEVAIMETLFAFISLLFHNGTIFVSAFAYGGGLKYFLYLKCWIEIGISVVDAVNLWFAFSIASGQNVQAWIENPGRLIVAMGAVSVFLHAIRIFHVFYTILKPKTKKQQEQTQLRSIQGIFVNRHYSGMRFCFEQLQLLQPLEEGLSEAFSLQFYGTREKTDDASTLSLAPWNSHFNEGRPDWESIFRKAIKKAYLSNPRGESIGVFFCGSPAIAKSLRSIADKVNAQHQYTMKKRKGRTSRCKIVVHVENF